MKCSIIIPTYKGTDSLPIAIKSVLNQNINDYEIIISDDNFDGSEEQINTEKIIKLFNNDKIIYLKNGHHNGSYARNKGLEIATGDIVSLLDDDDFYLKGYLTDAIDQFTQNNNIDLLFYNVIVLTPNNKAKTVSCPNINSKKLLFLQSEIGTGSNFIFRSKLIKDNKFDERYIRHQDIEFAAKLMNKIYYLWIEKNKIVKCFNKTNNYPNVSIALEMQELLRNDMLNNNIISKEEYTKLKCTQLQSLYNDLLAKNAPNIDIKKLKNILKENNMYSIKNKLLYFLYNLSKKMFDFAYKLYFKGKFSVPNNDIYKNIIDYKKEIEKELEHENMFLNE